MQAHPQKFWVGENPRKISENQGKISGNLGKICGNLCKISENLGKLPETTSKNGDQHALIWENSAQKTWRRFYVFLEVIRNTVFMQSPKSGPKLFGQVQGNSGKNYLHSKNLPALAPMYLAKPLVPRKQRWADCEIFQSESRPDPIKLNPIQSCPQDLKKSLVRSSPAPQMWNHSFFFCLMKQKNCWSYFSFSQIRLVESTTVSAVLLPHEAEQTQPFGIS